MPPTVESALNHAEQNLPQTIEALKELSRMIGDAEEIRELRSKIDRLGSVNLEAIDGTTDQFDGVFLSNYASLNIQPELARVEGVGEGGGGALLGRHWHLDRTSSRLTS